MNTFKLVCFDLDDTLWPCMPTILRAEKSLYNWLEKHRPEVTQIYSVDELRSKRLTLASNQPELKHNLTELRKASFKELSSEFNYDTQWVDEAFNVFYEARQQISFYDDVASTLLKLKKQYQLAAMTNGNADIYRTSLGHLFDYSISAEEVGSAKPDSDMFEALLAQSDRSADEILYIGDHPIHDIEGAHNMGIVNVWLNRHGDEWSHQDVTPDHMIQSLHELVEYLGLKP